MRKKRKVEYCFGLIAGLMFVVQFTNAQQSADSSKAPGLRSMLKATVSWHIGFEWEKRIGEKSTVTLFGGIGIGLQADGFTDYKARYIISPGAYAEYRDYYNLLKRITKRKKTGNNSANFLFGRIETIFPVKNQNYFGLVIMEGWGLQRVLYKKLVVGAHLGIIEHFYYDKPPDGGYNYLRLEPEIESSLSYVF